MTRPEAKRPPCPFCGKQDTQIVEVQSDDEPKRFIAFAVHCRDCLARGPLTARIGWAESGRMAEELWIGRAARTERMADDVAVNFSKEAKLEIEHLSALWRVDAGEAISRCIGLAAFLADAERDGYQVVIERRWTRRQVTVRDWVSSARSEGGDG